MTTNSDTIISDNLLVVEDLKGFYKGSFGIVHGVNGVSFSVKAGDMVAIAGESGCGKSTLAELITGTPRPLLHFEGGKILVENFDVYRVDPEVLRTEVKCKRMSYVPQASLESLNPVKRIRDLLMDVIKERTGEKITKTELLEMAKKHFERVGLTDRVLDCYPHELSGGMKQRTVIAISTMWNPQLLIIDEPTSALDVSSQQRMVKMLYELKEKGIIKSILFISHDLGILRQLCNTCIIMYCGKITEKGDMNDIVHDPLHPYTKGLISSFVSYHPDGNLKKLTSIPGSHPDLRNPPPGCKFHVRCPECMPKCKVEEPPMFEPKGKNRQVNCWLYEEA